MSSLKRSLEESSHDGDRPSPSDSSSTAKATSPVAPAPSAASSFRNVSACNRCRLRKNRCDQRLPFCASCDKAGVKCVGYDPITKREIPRRYAVWMSRLASAGTDQRKATSTTSRPASHTSRRSYTRTRSSSRKPTTSTRPLPPMAPSHPDPPPSRRRLAMAPPSPRPPRQRRRARGTTAKSSPSWCRTSAWCRCRAPAIRDTWARHRAYPSLESCSRR
jgi:hypothetical protein